VTGTTDPERWRRIEAALQAALDAPDSEHPRILHEACGDDADLRAEVEALLRADARAEGFLSSPAADAARGLLADWAASDLDDLPPLAAGRTVGAYRILRTLGEGGMGVVYEAEQEHPRRSVALKLIRGSGSLDPYQVRLFEREAQALGRLVHPGIATILEAGRTGDGQPFFAMELVQGTPLGEWLAARPPVANDRAEIRQRVELFLEVCDAIAYAHQRGVIHRDIKPSNVVVMDPSSGTGGASTRSTRRTANSASTGTAAGRRVKVLDFGLARFIDGDGALSRGGTEARLIQGTLPYMSPEQARADLPAMDVRSDVYSLGVLLYWLLTSRLPYEVPASPLHEGVRAVCEATPRRPRQVSRALGGDLETIVLKALEKDPGARYPGVPPLAEDLRRYLADFPILARPQSTMYQLRKIFARHRGPVVFAGALLLAVFFGIAGTTLGMLRARRAEADARTQAATAEQVAAYLEGLFQAADPVAGPGETTVRELLARGTERIDTELAEQPVVRARLLSSLSRVHEHLGMLAEARDLSARALATAEELHGPQHASLADLLNQTGFLATRLGEYAAADTLLRRGLVIAERHHGPEHPEVAECLYNLAIVRNELGDFAEGERLLTRALEIRETALGPDAEAVGINLDALANTRTLLGKYDEAVTAHARSRAIFETLLGPDHPRVGISWLNAGGAHYEAGDREAARVAFETGGEILRKKLPPEHPWLSTVSENVGVIRMETGDADGARPLLEDCLAARLAAYGEQHPETARVLRHLGNLDRDAGDAVRAHEYYARSRAASVAALGEQHLVVAEVLADWAKLHRATGGTAEAERLEAQASAIRSANERAPVSSSP